VGKVKKAGAVRKSSGKRSAKAKKATSGVTKVARTASPVPAKGRKATKAAKPTKASQRRSKGKATKKPLPPPPVSTFHVRELDPLQKCGAGTSVQRMFRIDETNGGVVKPHLVFYDKHGLYCEHGRDCPAVPHARSVMAHDKGVHP
jgi:hypothetical protein